MLDELIPPTLLNGLKARDLMITQSELGFSVKSSKNCEYSQALGSQISSFIIMGNAILEKVESIIHQHFWPNRQRLRNRNSLLHPPRQLGRTFISSIG